MIGNPSLVNLEIPKVVTQLELKNIFEESVCSKISIAIGSRYGFYSTSYHVEDYLLVRNKCGYNIGGLSSKKVDYCDEFINDLVEFSHDGIINWTSFCKRRNIFYFDQNIDFGILEKLDDLLKNYFYLKLDQTDVIKASVFKSRIYPLKDDMLSNSEIASKYNLTAESIRKQEKLILKDLFSNLTNSYPKCDLGFWVSPNFSNDLLAIFSELALIPRVNDQELLMFLIKKFKSPKYIINKYIYILYILFHANKKSTSEILNKKPFF